MKNKINILIPIFVVLVLIYVIRSAVGTHVQVETLRQGNMEDMVSTKGIVVKYETVLKPTAEGVFEPLAQEGERVSLGQEVAALYSGDVDTELRSRLEQVKKKIAQLEANQANLLSFTGDVSRLEQKIAEQTAAVIESSQSGDMGAVSEQQFIIEALCEKKAQIAGGGASGGTLEELRAQKAELENQIGAAHHWMVAPVAGEFTSTVDGYEELITPDNMTALTPSAVDELLAQDRGQEEKKDAAACKIIKNFRYFIVLNLPADRVGSLRAGDKTNLRFYDLSGDLVSGTVFFVSDEQEGMQTVILESTRHIESLLKRRFVNLEFIKKRYAGYRLSVKSLRTKDGVTGVYVRRDEMMKFIPVTILYNTQDIAIVDSADTNNPLRLYDEVIVRASSYEEGKLLR